MLVLDGEGKGLVNDLCVPSQVAPSYSANGRSLISASVLDDVPESDDALVAAVRAQMRDWFGDALSGWQHLRTYHVRHALPAQQPGRLRGEGPRVRPGLYVAGDHREAASLQGAMLSGRRAAEAILEV